MYVAVKGGERAILNSYKLLNTARRGDASVPELSVEQIREQMRLAVDRVMTEGSVCDPDLAALAIKQAAGDLVEAVFLLRAFRATLPRLGYTAPVDTTRMLLKRRISATFKDIPGGQMLGPTYDYTQRLLDFSLAALSDADQPGPAEAPVPVAGEHTPSAIDLLRDEGLIEQHACFSEDLAPPDLTREPHTFPACRAARLQNLARADEGFLLGMGYSTQRGYGNAHPFVGEIRAGAVAVEFTPPELGFPIQLGEIALTECQMVNQFLGSKTEPPQFTRGYGLVFGRAERKAMAMALVDRGLRSAELGEDTGAPAQDPEFVLYHCDNVEATGFVEHLKLPHYVDFQSELENLRGIRAAAQPEDAA